MIPIDDIIEIWLRVHQEYSEKKIVEMFSDASLAWWRESLACLRPPSPPDDGTTAE